MSKKNIARGSATRTANMNKRKQQILDCAGQIISTQGIEALTLPKLADEAGVTIPTIHNLIGKKSDIFEKLANEMVDKIGEALSAQQISDPITAAETFIDKLMELYASNEALYKAAFVVGERNKLFDHENPEGIFAKSLQLTIQVCQHGKAQGYLLGEIDAIKLAHELFGCQRLARYDWMNDYIDLSHYRSQVLVGMFVIFAADASATYKTQLLAKIDALSAQSNVVKP